MVAETYIKRNLRKLDRLYRNPKEPKITLFYAKMAILELCGWIEESMDDIIKRCARRNLKLKRNKDFIEESIIKKTYGFSYQGHFRRMLINTIGIILTEKIESKADNIKIEKMRASLGVLKKDRDKLAHTYIRSSLLTISAPSKTIALFSDVYEGLKEIEATLKRCNL